MSLVISTSAGAGPEPSSPKTIENVKQLAGCFDVTYRFAEDGRHDMFSPDWGLQDPVREWVGFERAPNGAVILRHVSITPEGRAASHWYEVWTYHAAEKAWTQEVWGGSPEHSAGLRYRCTAPWQKNRWSCHAGRAPKPFRDQGAPFGFTRTDYEWLDRHNILLVTPQGWVQNENNKKLNSSGAAVSYELGWITYQRIEEEKCRPAIDRVRAPRSRS